MDEADYQFLMSRQPAGQEMTLKSVEQGAATSVWAATSPELAGRGGVYLEDCQVAGPATADSSAGVESYAVDAAAAERLWAVSEVLVGQSFEF
jgi:hypothetical protein